MDKLAQVPDVVIDKGTFKYILAKIYVEDDDKNEVSKLVVRGFESAEFHADIYEKFQKELPKGFDSEVLGGGRIQNDEFEIKIYGYSQGYGKADHSKTLDILKKHYPDAEISYSNDGY